MSRRVAFFAPMKPPNHPTPSGDRKIARLTFKALQVAGFEPFLASDLRTLDMEGSRQRQTALIAEAELEVQRLLEDLSHDPPAFWFTYHNYYKAPDLIGPAVARSLSIPYFISEPSRSPRRLKGRWENFAECADMALSAANGLFWSTERDRPALEDARRDGQALAHLPPFIDPGPRPARVAEDGPLRMLTVAMMRDGDKKASYQALADALALVRDVDWRLAVIGDGPAAKSIRALFADFRGRVEFSGLVEDPIRLRAAYEASELFVWPGVNEGIGLVYLEAQAAGLPCIAERRPGPMDVIESGEILPDPFNAGAFASAIMGAARDREALAVRGARARTHVETRHSLEMAAARIARVVAPHL